MYRQKRPAGLPPPGSLWGAVYLAALTLIPFAALIPATMAFSARLTGWRLGMRFLGRPCRCNVVHGVRACGSMVAALLPWLPHVLNGGDRVSVHTVLCAGRSGGRATCRL